jgi:hypothetical protein
LGLPGRGLQIKKYHPAIAGSRHASMGLDIRGGQRQKNGSWDAMDAMDCVLASRLVACSYVPVRSIVVSPFQFLSVQHHSECMLCMQGCSFEGRRTRDEGYGSYEKEVDPGT